MTTRLCLWSGPRNLSTAMMRSFGARADTGCADEPFYAAYLAATGADHPMREDILAAGQTDPDEVARRCAGSAPNDAPIFYQKQMVHHLLEDFPREWLTDCRHAFLIRAPERVLASFAKKAETVTLADVGFVQQAALWDDIQALTGSAPAVMDTDRLLGDPEGQLRQLCGAFGVPFDPSMLSWTPGRKPEDGVWAAHWYASVDASSGFGPPKREDPALPPGLQTIADAARPHYERLARYAF